jgi:cytidine deaminase
MPDAPNHRLLLGRLSELAQAAWSARENAYVIGPTKVGCAVLATDGRIYSGCNVEHRFRSHDVHAEVNAITNMVAAGTTHKAVTECDWPVTRAVHS